MGLHDLLLNVAHKIVSVAHYLSRPTDNISFIQTSP